MTSEKAEQSAQNNLEKEYAVLGEGEGPAMIDPIPQKRLIALILGPLFAIILFFLPAPEGMTAEAWRLVALATWMVIWWLGEAVPIPATALLPIPMMPLLGIAEMRPVAANYSHTLIFLFLGEFILAAAMQRWGLHKRIALKIVSIVGTSPGGIIAGFMVATAFLSMWISNTATTIMMYAVGISVISFIAQKTDDKVITSKKYTLWLVCLPSCGVATSVA